MKNLEQDLKTGNLKQVYLLYGDEPYLINLYKNRLKKALIADEDTINLNIYEGKGIPIPAVIDQAETMPFFAEHRLIMLENTGFFKGSCPELADYLPTMPPETVMVFVESEVDKRGKLYKAVKSQGRAVELTHQNEKVLTSWILGLLQKEGVKITRSGLQLFLERTGDDMERITRELDKLIAYVWGREGITAEDVEAVCTEQTENRIFEMIQAITEQNQKKALDLYSDLLAMKEPPMRILFLITRQFNQLMQPKLLSGRGLDKSELAKKAGIPPFALGKYQAQARRFSTGELKMAVEDCVDTEERVKTGQMGDQISVELLIVKYSTKKRLA